MHNETVIFSTAMLAVATSTGFATPTLYATNPVDVAAERQAAFATSGVDEMNEAERAEYYINTVSDSRYAMCHSMFNNSLGDEDDIMGCVMVPYIHGTDLARQIFGN